MMVLSNFLISLASIIHYVITIYIWVIIISALISWVRPDPNSPVVQILYKLTAPAYSLVHRFIRPIFNGIDLTPIVIILFLQFLDMFLIKTVVSFVNTM